MDPNDPRDEHRHSLEGRATVSRYGRNRGVPEYDDFRTGLTFAGVRRDMKGSFKYRRRHAVLGYWHEVKVALWEYYTGQRLR